MKKLVIVVIGLVLIMILVAIGLFLFYNLPFIKEGSYSQEDFSTCQKLQDNSAYNISAQSYCFLNLAEKNNSLSLCNNIKSSDIKNNCYGVVKNRNMYCSKIKDNELKSNCLSDVSMNNKSWCQDIPIIKYFCKKYSQSERLSLCKNIVGQYSDSRREICFTKLAIDFKNKSLCDNSDTTYSKDKCYGSYMNSLPDENTCDLMSTQYEKEVCYYNTAEKLKDKKLCEKIIDLKNKDICYGKVAAAAEDITLCKGIGNQSSIEGCYFDVFEKTKNNSICNLFTIQNFKDACNLDTVSSNSGTNENCDVINDTGLKDYCYRDAGKLKNDPNYCEKIQQSEIRDECFAYVGFNLKNITYCNRVGEYSNIYSSDTWKEYCYEGAAVDNIDICYSLGSDKWKRQCILTIIVDKLKDPKLCSQIRVGQYIEDPTIKDDCYYELAMSLKNPELCNQINNSKSLQDCKSLSQ